jgi:hypothetical protein
MDSTSMEEIRDPLDIVNSKGATFIATTQSTLVRCAVTP